VGDDSNKADDFERLDSIEESDSGFTDYLDSVSSVSFRHTRGETDKKLEALQNTAAPRQSLNDSLNEQWRLVETDELVKQAGSVIIDYIDDKGYLAVRIEQLHNSLQGPGTRTETRSSGRRRKGPQGVPAHPDGTVSR